MFNAASSVLLLACTFFVSVTLLVQGRSYCNSQCSRKRTFYEHSTGVGFFCNCDIACFSVFSDCCPDYRKYCGEQKTNTTLDATIAEAWKCVGTFGATVKECANGASGVWMIQKYPKDWKYNTTRTKCEAPGVESLPVVGACNNLTYRNAHCAECHGVKNYSTWGILVHAYIIPPENLDLKSKLRYILDNGGKITRREPTSNQPRRYCAGSNYTSNCTDTKHADYHECLNGPIEVVMDNSYHYYKNQACGACNGQPGLKSWFVRLRCNLVPNGFTLAINEPEPGAKATTTILEERCPIGTVFDTSLEFCREGYALTSKGKLTNEFLVVLWILNPTIPSHEPDIANRPLISSLNDRFVLQDNQITTLTWNKQDTTRHTHIFFAVTFRLTLTPFQSFVLANQHRPSMNFTRKNTAFLKLLNFTEKFNLTWRGRRLFTFHVAKTAVKQLACYGEKKFQSNEYKMYKGGNESLVVNETGEIFLLKYYTLIKGNGGNITLCRKLILADCNEGAYVPLAPKEYVIFPNFSLYHNATDSLVKFGDYLISESLNKEEGNVSDVIQDSTVDTLPQNATISICLPFKDTFYKTETKYITNPGYRASYGVRVFTLVTFSTSITCLVLLLITYGLFQELRTVPGMNLMNLSFSMLLSQLLWLIGTTHFKRTILCKIFAILDHYFFQASFLALSIISYHTCHVFSQPFEGRISNKSLSSFLKYSAFVWLAPAIFVAVCVALDETEVFLVDYGRNCWLGTFKARLYLFLLPLALSLLYNICTFIKTAVILARQQDERRALQFEERKQNLVICTKLATLVGFPWLFAFLSLFFPDAEALQYLFVGFVCLQGLFIATAFVFNNKILGLYKSHLNNGRKNVG